MNDVTAMILGCILGYLLKPYFDKGLKGYRRQRKG